MISNCLHINSARHIRGYLVEIVFDDGTTKIVDVLPLLTGEVFEPLRNQRAFSRFTIDPISKTLVWPNGADLAPEALHDLPAVAEVA